MPSAFFSCVKKFLRSLKEPVIPHSLWRTFVDAANNPDTTDAETALYQVRNLLATLIIILGFLSPFGPNVIISHTINCSLSFQAVSELPRPNRDSLAYLILHLQRVADSGECKMSAENLSTVMGPTIVGYSSR